MKLSSALKDSKRYFEFHSEWDQLKESDKLQLLWIVIGELLSQVEEDVK